METEHVKKKWQNLIHKQCIKCDAPLVERKDRVTLYECTNEASCDFFITRRKMFEILSDETHIMRRFLSYEELEKLEAAVDGLLA